jgi:thioredoxin 1
MSDLIKHISDASFEADVLNSDKPVLVDFWAEWCGPCKMIAPILDDVAKEYQGRLSIVKLNVDDNQAVPAKFGIRGIQPDPVQKRRSRCTKSRRTGKRSAGFLYRRQYLSLMGPCRRCS